MRIEPAPSVEAPMVFAGYGLQVPEAEHDDLAGLDLKGKIVVLLTGGPSNIPGPLLAHYQNTRWDYLQKAGAIGTISIQNPKGRTFLGSDRSCRASCRRWRLPIRARRNARAAGRGDLQSGSRGETVHRLRPHVCGAAGAVERRQGAAAFRAAGLARASRWRLSATTLESDNVIGILPGTDPTLTNEYVVISAHLDHVGVGEPINGDAIYNGAMDNASGIATLLETAAAAAAAGGYKRAWCSWRSPPKRRACSDRAISPIAFRCQAAIVANLNTDMFLPLFPLKSLVVQGLEESDLANDLKRVARPLAIEVLSDPEPERNAFVRSDQYSFIKTGVPALSLKVGFTKDSPEHQIVKRWRTERYHAPSDDLESAGRSQGRRGFRQGLPRRRRRGRQPADPAAVEQRQLLQALRQVTHGRVLARAGARVDRSSRCDLVDRRDGGAARASLDPLLAEAEARVRISPPAESAAVRTMYKKVGIDPTKTRPSNEALLRRVRKGDAIPRINSAVDVVNWCSLEFQLPYGLYDFSKISGPVTMRIGAEGEKYAGIRKDEVNVGGRITVADDIGAFGNPHFGFGAHDGDAGDDRITGDRLRAERDCRNRSRASRPRHRRADRS